MSYVTPPPGHRLAAETTLGPVHLEVADLTRSLAYYQSVPGFRLLGQHDGLATLGAHGDDTPLLELHEVKGARPHPPHKRLGLYHFAILLPTRAALGQFAAHLARIGAYAGQSDHLVSEAFYLTDPDGLGIEVYADRPRSEWPVVNNRLQMAVDPLDMDSLLRAGGDTKWTGLPAGTKIGHVHLHVGDISDAEGFFHRALGFDSVTSMPGALFLSAGDYHHHLGLNTWAGRAPRPGPGDARLLEWTVQTPTPEDAEAAARSLERAGHKVERTEDGWVAEDPWGTRVRIK
jgi:catechol 2,3-dioxygenase